MGDVEMADESKPEVTEAAKGAESKPSEAGGDAKAETKTEDGAEVKKENGNGEANGGDNNERAKLLELGVHVDVVNAMMKLLAETDVVLDDFDERAVEMLKQFPTPEGVYLVEQLTASKLFGVQNKPQYLMSVMRNLRDRIRQLGASYVLGRPLICGPNIEDIKAVLDRTGYKLEVTVGQRKYGGPPPDWEGLPTGPGTNGHEIYIGHIPHEMYEDKIIPMFETIGKIWDLRLMMDPMTGQNRGYAFLTYCERSKAAEAAKKMDGYEIAGGKTLKVNVSIANTRLFIGNIPKSKTKEEILEEFRKHAEGVTDVIIYTSPDAGERNRNRGFCFVDFVDHKAASDAKRKFSTAKPSSRPFGHELVIDWAEQQEEPTEEEMAKVKACYVRNLRESYTEDQLKERFEKYGKVERLKKVKEYAFIHFETREACLKAIEAENGAEIEGIQIECSLAKPQGDKKKRGALRGGFGRGGSDRGGGPAWGGRGRGYGGSGGGWGGRGGGATGYAEFSAGYDGGYGGYGGGGYGDPYAGGYGGGYGGYGGGPGGYGGGGYGGGPGGYGGGYGGGDYGGYGGGGYGGGRGSSGTPVGGYRGGGRGGGRGGFRGKRTGDWTGGPASKRADHDFSADVNMGGF